MRVLQLAPPSASAITAHTFIDEEIRALAEAGVTCFAISDAHSTPRHHAGVEILPVASPPDVRSIRRTLELIARHAALLPVPMTSLSSARAVFHALRIESAAVAAIVDHGINLVHSHFGWPLGFGGMMAAAETRVPLVASLRGMDLLQRPDLSYGLRQDALYDCAVRRLLGRADRTVYATEFMRAEGVKAGAPHERTIVVRKGVDLDRFRPPVDRVAVRRALGIDAPLILAAGTLRPLKGYPVLLDALATVTALEWTAIICGEGPERRALEARAADLRLGDRVRFAGSVPRDRIAALFAGTDVFVHASHIEAAGNVILEALASGCAVVTTDCGGPGEYVRDGETGFVVPAGDNLALAARVSALLEQPALRMRFGDAARRDVERRFTYRRMIDDLRNVYTEALGLPAKVALSMR